MQMSAEMKSVDLDKLIPYARNARTHSPEQIRQLQASIREFGFVNPVIIDSEYNIIAGHGRVLAARAEGLAEVPCVFVNHLTEAQKRAYILADNRLAEMAGWDEELLKIELGGLQDMSFDIDLTGFADGDIDLDDAPKEVAEDEYEVNLPVEPVSRPGQIYKLGAHRVMCGDSTDPASWSQLMAGARALLVVTDPPYNMNYEGAGRTPKARRLTNKLINDKLPDDKFHNFLVDSLESMRDCVVDGASFYVFYKELGAGVFFSAFSAAGLTFKQELIWVKHQIVLGGAKYQNMYEPCLFGCKGDQVKFWRADRKERSVIESTDFMSEAELIETVRHLMADLDADVLREKKNAINDLHPTMKPIRLLARFISNSSDRRDGVIDGFGGSGSTLIACEQLDRSCYMMELDPKYVDVIIDRWESLTGEKAVLLNG